MENLGALSRAHAEWCRQLCPEQFQRLFDVLPGTMFFAKDGQRRLQMGNAAFVRRCGLTREAELIGLRDEQVFPPKLAAKYARDDRKVLSSGQPLLGLIELFPDADGLPEWYVTDKLPLVDRAGSVVGLCGIVRSFGEQRAAMQPYLEFADIAARLRDELAAPLRVAELAAELGLSVRQFERKFRATFQTTPRAFHTQMRVLKAKELLRRTRLPITEIALQAGFYDHSDFARQFRRHMGISARQFRQQTATAGS